MLDSPLFTSDLALNVLQFLSVKDSSSLASTSSRYYYLVHQFRRLICGTELSTVASHIRDVRSRQKTADQVVKKAIDGVRTVPNFALGFSTRSASTVYDVEHGFLAESLSKSLPTDTAFVVANSGSIQSANIDGVECQSKSLLMLGSLSHQSEIHPFYIPGTSYQGEMEFIVQNEFDHMSWDHSPEWKVFIVYVCGRAHELVDEFLVCIQRQYPEALVVGGICGDGVVSISQQDTNKSTLTRLPNTELISMYEDLKGRKASQAVRNASMGHDALVDLVYNELLSRKYSPQRVSEGIFGIALAGDVPVQSVVSRGVKSRLTDGDPGATTPFYVAETRLVRCGDPEFFFGGDDAPPFHLVRRIEDRESGQFLTPAQLVSRFGEPEFLGIQREDEDGFELLDVHPISYSTGSFVIPTSWRRGERSLLNANINFFYLHGGMCMKDLETKMQLLKQQTAGQKLLGALMYSCSARGPLPNMLITERMGDAERFADVFRDVPLLGFYAGGEIGPTARVGQRCVFQRGHTTLQGFTAVFALFIVPIVDVGSIQLDDSPQNVKSFLAAELGKRTVRHS